MSHVAIVTDSASDLAPDRAAELGIAFDPVPAHTKGIGSYGADEVPRQERPTPLRGEGGAKRRKKRRRGHRGVGGDGR